MSVPHDDTNLRLLNEMRDKRLGWLTLGQETAIRYDPKFFQKYDAIVEMAQLLSDEARGDSVVEKGIRELLIVTSLASRMYPFGIRVHLSRALDSGISPAYIVQAMETLLSTGGAPSYFMVLQELGEELEARAAEAGHQ